MSKPCGHPAHPEDRNIGGGLTPSPRAAEIDAHRADPAWFTGRFCKLGFPADNGSKEYMWVLVRGAEGELLKGVLKNYPALVEEARYGDLVEFTSDEIVDVYDGPLEDPYLTAEEFTGE